MYMQKVRGEERRGNAHKKRNLSIFGWAEYLTEKVNRMKENKEERETKTIKTI